MKRKLLAILLSLTMIMLSMNKVVFAEHNHTDWINWGDEEAELTSLPSSEGNYYLTNDVTLSSTWNVPGTTNLCLNGHVIKTNGDNFSVITVGANNTLNLYDCNNTSHDGYVDTDGLWHLGTGSGISKTITGGIITGGHCNDGGGVFVSSSGTFNMYGGIIAGNKANNCGGGVNVQGTFNMYNGVIEYNKANYKTKDNYWGGGGVAIYDKGNATFSGGKIQYNSSAANGGGVLILQKDTTGTRNVLMTGVSITNNTAEKKGGGVYFDNSTVTVTLGGKTNIKENMVGENENNFHYSTDASRSGTIKIGTGSNAPASEFSVGVTITEPKIIDETDANYTGYFFSDNPVYAIRYVDNKLELVKGWELLQNALNGTTTETTSGLFEISGDTEKVIKLLTDFKADTNNTTLTVSGTKILDLNGHVIDANGISTVGSVITVPNNASLTLKDSDTGNKEYKFTVDNNGLFKYSRKWKDTDLESNTVKKVVGGIITGGTGDINENFGGGVFVASGGTLVMNKGTIVGCSATKGGGVFSRGSFTMNGNSAIIGCTATVDGGGVCAINCAFIMEGYSKVSECVAGNGAGGVYTWAAPNETASFTMKDNSIISNCKASAGYASNIRSGGGVCVENSTFNMDGGEITNNTTTNGGGVNVFSGTFNMDDGKIDNNTASSHGGGIYLAENAIVNITNGSIENNHSNASGGAVQVDGNFKMSGGTIKCNEADIDGGGLSVNGGKGQAILTGTSKILNNTANNQGGGVSYYGSADKVFLGGSVQITGNIKLNNGTTNNVYLFYSNLYVTLGTSTNGTDGNRVLKPSQGMMVGVTTCTPPAVGSPVKFTSNGTANDVYYFVSDNNDYDTRFNTDHLQLILPNAYQVTDGANSSINISRDKSTAFTSTAEFSKFVDVKVDNTILTRDRDYSVVEGSTKVTLKASYLNSLSVGEHVLDIISTDGNASTSFTITKDSSSPKPKYKTPKTGVEN